jgi:tyrosyl-tRNA synthetase
MTGNEVNVYSVPLLVDASTGRKFGKTEDGAVWLDSKKTSPTQFYQFWINTSDNVVENYLKIFTELSKEEIEETMSRHNEDRQKRLAQTRLAEQVTILIHGEQDMRFAKAVTDYLTAKTLLSEIDGDVLKIIRREIPSVKASPDGSIIDALVTTGLASSNTAARQLLNDQAVSINGERVSRDQFNPSDFQNGRLLIRRGKAFKDSALVEQG